MNNLEFRQLYLSILPLKSVVFNRDNNSLLEAKTKFFT